MDKKRAVWSALAAATIAGCASWREPAPTIPVTAAARNPSTQATVVVQAMTTPAAPAGAATPIAAATPAIANSGSAATSAPANSAVASVDEAASAAIIQAQSLTPLLREETPRQEEPVAALTRGDEIALAAESLERGDKLAAARHLERYVHDHPEQIMFRLQLAELLVQANQDFRAHAQFEQFLATAPLDSEPIRKYLVHIHTRLMEIAQRQHDDFGELLHRGIGLLILVEEQDRNPDRDAQFCEEMLCKALRAFTEAREINNSDARVRVYLAEVYRRMGNRRGATTERAAARARVQPGELSRDEETLILLPGR